jgi:hypothetical protein
MKKTPIAFLAAAAIFASTAVIASPDGPYGSKERGEHHFLKHHGSGEGLKCVIAMTKEICRGCRVRIRLKKR